MNQAIETPYPVVLKMQKTLFLVMILAFSTLGRSAPFDKGSVNGPGTRAAGMGGAFVALADDASAAWWNPAGLIQERDQQITAEYANLLGNGLTEGFFMDRGYIPAFNLGYAVGYRAKGSNTAVHYSEEAGQVSLATPFSEDQRVLFGATLKYLQTQMDILSGSASGLGLDVGFLYRIPLFQDKFTFGLSVLDLQSFLIWSNGFSQSIPQLIQAGVAYRFDNNTNLEFDLEDVNDLELSTRSSQGFRTGVEHWFDEKPFAIRVGYFQSSAISGRFSLGLGYRYKEFEVDYAFLQDVNQLGPSHRFSANFRFSLPSYFQQITTSSPTRVKVTETPVTAQVSVTATPTKVIEPKVIAPNLRLKREIVNGAKSGGSLVHLLPSVEGNTLNVRTWQMLVRDQHGKTVYKTDGASIPGPLDWDGRDDQGRSLEEGNYSISLELKDSEGKSLSIGTNDVNLPLNAFHLNLKPNFASFSPSSGSKRPEVVFEILGEGSMPALRSAVFNVAAKESKNKILRSISLGKKLAGEIAWDGKNKRGKVVKDGVYLGQVELTFKDGIKKSASAQVTVDTKAPQLSLEVDPVVFTPGNGVVKLNPKISNPEIAGALSWNVRIENADGSKVKELNGEGLPGDSVIWDGLDTQGRPAEPGSLYYASFSVNTESGTLAKSMRVPLESEIKAFHEESALRVPLSTVYFAPGDEIIDLDQYALLKGAAEAVKKYGTNYLVQIKAYCDNDEAAKGGAISPLELSILRAKAVADYLIQAQGLPKERVAFAGYARSTELGSASAEEAKKKARRAEIILFTK